MEKSGILMMKTMYIPRCLLLLIMNCSVLFLFSQSPESRNLRLVAEKEGLLGKTVLFFKPGKRLAIKTNEGKKIVAVNYYSVHENYLVMNMNDTIPLENISWIQGKVYGDIGRKTLGIVTAGLGLGLVFLGAVLTAGTGESQLLIIMLPGVVLGADGVFMTGTRKFSRIKSWTFKTAP
jgi:hypothetical protein